MADLKPCPNCGNEEIWKCNVVGRRSFYFECAQCHWCGKNHYRKHRAVYEWNHMKRPHKTKVEVKIEEDK